ncbi:MAG: DUF1700 domain-containing protein [Lachnospiraceae bacterium]|nr:DUF1700 domain-containing protein [Lachnospiraceae bacterium]MBQ1993361.1 DUF1700 domain-containing protein [Lachnospiraceae bacterium]MEE0920631.1 DUF1700 domain-containing protein [Lachnospiraceae bacterium]
MRQDEFLNSLKDALVGKVPEQVIYDNINYYKDYINSQIKNGRSESDILASLGDPRLLAKTIEESNKFSGNTSNNGYYDNSSYNNSYGNMHGNFSSNYNSGYDYSQNDSDKKGKVIQFKGWFILGIVILLLVIIVMLVFKVAVALAPVALLVIAVSIVVKGIKQWKNG